MLFAQLKVTKSFLIAREVKVPGLALVLNAWFKRSASRVLRWRDSCPKTKVKGQGKSMMKQSKKNRKRVALSRRGKPHAGKTGKKASHWKRGNDVVAEEEVGRALRSFAANW
jgi:hypothetical protein